MSQFVYFIIVYSILVFIWSYVYANARKGDKINYSFILFLGVILVWMLVNRSNQIINSSPAIVIDTINFFAMLNLSIVFLNFVYRLIDRKYDFFFYGTIILNTLTIFSRYLFPIDYSNPSFWRMNEINVGIATIMATIFSLPMFLAIFLAIKYYRETPNPKLKTQLKYVLNGIGFASVIGIVSEYIVPSFLHSDSHFSLMNIAILVLISFLFFAIVKHQFLNIQVEYIYQKLFLFSNEGIILIDKNMSILSINQAAKAILKNGDFNEDMEIRKYIKEYDFNVNYNQHETTVEIGNELFYLLISQSPMEEGDRITAKLLHITDVTKNKLNIKEEKERLVTQSTTDILTNLYNKRYYIDNYINKQIGKQNRILVFVDIDDFKYINDNYGHIIGDEVLQTVAENIKNSVDTNAKAIRYGGDEFLIIIENTSLNDAKSIVQRIQDSVKTIEYEEIDRKKITLSIGICEGEEDINVLAERADKAMYYSKTHGKNRTAIYSKENIN